MANRIFKATKISHCGKCDKEIAIGEHITWPRRGQAWYRVHVHCGVPCTCEETAVSEPISLNSQHVNGNGYVTPTTADPASAAVSALAAVIEPLIAARVLSADAIRELIEEEVRIALESQPEPEPKYTTLQVQLPNGTVNPVNGPSHKQFSQLLALIASRTDIYLYGAPGGGKSTAVKQIADALSLDYATISLNVQTSASVLSGYLDATGRYVSTRFRELYEHGGIFLIDEADNASANLLTTLNTALGNHHMAFPDAVIERHPDFICVGAGNTVGRGASRQHADRRQFDAAFADRFFFLAWDYDEELERNVALSITPSAKAWVEWVQLTRCHVKEQSLHNVVVTPRASIKGAQLIANGINDYRSLADGLVFKGLETNQVKSILATCSLPNS